MDTCCKNCKYYRIYESCNDDKQRERMEDFWADGVCKKYLPIESYHHINHKTNMGNIGDEYRWISTNYETFAEEISKNPDMKKKIIDSVTGNFIPDDIYIHLYEMATNYIKTYVYDSYPKPGDIHRKFINNYGYEDFEKCVADNANFIVGQLFMHIKKMEHNGYVSFDDFFEMLLGKGQGAVITYQTNNFEFVLDYSFSTDYCKHLNVDKKRKYILIKSGHILLSSDGNKREYIIKFFTDKIKEINKGKGDWLTRKRRYTVLFKDGRKLYFDIID